MNAKVSYALCSAALLVSCASLLSAQSQCGPVDKHKPPVSVTFERLVSESHHPKRKADNRALLRLNNNTDCTIVVDSNDEGPSLDLSALHREHVLKWTDALGNGRTVTLVYNIHNEPGARGTISVSDGCMVYERTLHGGESVLFSVPLVHFKKGADLSVRFKYASEEKGASSSPEDVFFRHQSLPKKSVRR